MSAIKNYFKQECNLLMLELQHPKSSDFYITVWQSTRSPLPLLIWRTLLFIASLGIVITSITFYITSSVPVGYWFIYLTHWGLTLMLLSTGFGAAISARCYFSGPISAEFSLPWYVKTYWALHNISVPLAFLITIFYWTLLYSAGFLEELNYALDIAIHGINSVVMLLLHMSSSHPTRFLHFLHPFAFAFIYVVFSIVYYVSGGTSPLGEPYIYPVVNWAEPGQATIVVIVTGMLLISLHFVTIGLAAIRDTVANRIIRPPVAVQVDEGLPLRNPNTATSIV